MRKRSMKNPLDLLNSGISETTKQFAGGREKTNTSLTYSNSIQRLTGFSYLHGRKGDRIVHVGPLNVPVTMEEMLF